MVMLCRNLSFEHGIDRTVPISGQLERTSDHRDSSHRATGDPNLAFGTSVSRRNSAGVHLDNISHAISGRRVNNDDASSFTSDWR